MFLKVFLISLVYVSPILILLAAMISGIGLWIGHRERWKPVDSVYFAFITATTVGYGDFHPKSNPSKYAAIIIAFIGVLFTGIIVAIGINAAETSFITIHGKIT